jgi:hypothetical protein
VGYTLSLFVITLLYYQEWAWAGIEKRVVFYFYQSVGAFILCGLISLGVFGRAIVRTRRTGIRFVFMTFAGVMVAVGTGAFFFARQISPELHLDDFTGPLLFFWVESTVLGVLYCLPVVIGLSSFLAFYLKRD